jgi:hypothetical protein
MGGQFKMRNEVRVYSKIGYIEQTQIGQSTRTRNISKMRKSQSKSKAGS